MVEREPSWRMIGYVLNGIQTTLLSRATNYFVFRQDSRNRSYITSIINTQSKIFSIQTPTRFKRTLIYYVIDSYSANVRGNPLCQASSNSCFRFFSFFFSHFFVFFFSFSHSRSVALLGTLHTPSIPWL